MSAFTLAHSMTLGLTLYGVIALPSSIVEPLIAMSIVYVAVENLVTSELKPWRVAPVQMRTSSVLELPGNSLRGTQTQVGDEIEIAVGRAPEVNKQ